MVAPAGAVAIRAAVAAAVAEAEAAERLVAVEARGVAHRLASLSEARSAVVYRRSRIRAW